MGILEKLFGRGRPPGNPVEGHIELFRFAEPGVIRLDDGREVTFDAADCDELVALVSGTRVRVTLASTDPPLRAVRVSPLATEIVEQAVWPAVGTPTGFERRYGEPDQPPYVVEIRRSAFDRDAVLASHPHWPDATLYRERALPAAEPERWDGLDVAPEPFFAPWHAGIRAAAAPCVHLLAADGAGPIAGTIGGSAGPVSFAWPECPRGCGPMTSVLCLEPTAFAHLSDPRRLVVHLCPTCVLETRGADLAETNAPASVEWHALGASAAPPPDGVLTIARVDLRSELALDFPPSWLSLPRRDVDGHVPITGVSSILFGTTLRVRRRDDAPFHYESAASAFDLHYRPSIEGVVVGGYSDHHFSVCPECGKPRRQLFHLNDYGELEEVLQGSNEVTLLSCDRTPSCGGPARGRLHIAP